ncbi:kelch-like protein 24a isoform X2 [Paroedura picta]
MYQGALLYDTTLIVNLEPFRCHRTLLAALSPYFRELFTSTWPNGREIELTNVDPSTMETILQYIYTEDIVLTTQEAPDIFAGASQLQIVPLQDLSCRFLIENLSMENCFVMHSLARAHKSQPLYRATIKLLALNFEEVFDQQPFLQLDLGTIIHLISSNDLMVASELKVYQAVRHWVSFQPSKRSPHLGMLMRYVRFPLFTTADQVELQRDLERWEDLQLKWKHLNGKERLRIAGGLRKGMLNPHILCVDTQMREYQEAGNEEDYMACYDPQTEKWEKFPGPDSLTHSCCAAGDNKIYISGGACRNSYSRALYEFDSFTCRWAQLPSMDIPRCVHGFLFYKDSLFAVGGWWKFQRFLNSAERFDIDRRRWTRIAQLPFALSHPASCVFRKKLYFLGGATGIVLNWMFHRGFLVYKPDSDTWIQVPLPASFLAAGAIAVDKGIYVIGGFYEKKPRDSIVGAMIPENCHAAHRCFFVDEAGKVTYSRCIPKLPQGLGNAGVVHCNNRIYVLGGEDLTQRYKTIYFWEAGEFRWRRCATEIPVRQEGISRFGCATWMRPQPHIHELFQRASHVLTEALGK